MSKRLSMTWLMAVMLVMASLASNVCEASCVPALTEQAMHAGHACCAHAGNKPGVQAIHASDCHHTMKEEARNVRAASDLAVALMPIATIAPASALTGVRLLAADAGPPRVASPPTIPLRI
ncbi:hypothetical protein [Silvibacterium sp.]|uniref:hypothetical protein n=1 Tax=Silvibacterium sp. TaxID=1964179 RepID=UPI0039E6DE13